MDDGCKNLFYWATIVVPANDSSTAGKPTTVKAATFAEQFTRHRTREGQYQQCDPKKITRFIVDVTNACDKECLADIMITGNAVLTESELESVRNSTWAIHG